MLSAVGAFRGNERQRLQGDADAVSPWRPLATGGATAA